MGSDEVVHALVFVAAVSLLSGMTVGALVERWLTWREELAQAKAERAAILKRFDEPPPLDWFIEIDQRAQINELERLYRR